MQQKAALEFLDMCANEGDVDKVVEHFLRTIGLFGFEASAGGGWVGVGASRAHRFYFNSWPKAWLDVYLDKGFFDVDPMVIETRRRMSPFLWSEMREAQSFTVEGKLVIDAAKAYGWSEVMGVPIHGPAGYQGLVSMASLRPVPLDATKRALLHAMALAVHDRAHASVGHGDSTRPPITLTPRETECIRWVAAGKTDAEIGIILGIAGATAHYHVEQVKKKAGTRSRSEAVALLVLAGNI
ncbi:MAG: autoinducer binding domain-containing protein [Hyphomicrobiales bacterium]|nr:autoinducer binding domain-containing protein [Hyphomicrobiales bacterium]